MWKTRFPAALAAGLAGLGGCWLFREALFSGATFGRRDLSVLHRPMKHLVTALAGASSGLPLWNPFLGAGQPFAANPTSELFHPMTGLFFLLPFEWAFRLQVIAPPLAGVLAMRFLARSLGASNAAALLAGLAWGFGGFLLSATCLLPTLFAAAALPALLAFFVLVGQRGRLREVAGGAAFLGLVLLAGEPSAALATAAAAPTAFAAGRRRSSSMSGGGRVPLTRSVVAALGTFVLGIGVAAAVLVPGLRHASMTARAAGISSAEAGDWSMPPLRLGDLVVPDLTGAADGDPRSARLQAALYPLREAPFLSSIYPGILVTALAFLGWIRKGASRIWLPCAVAGLLLAFGTNTPIWETLRHGVPFLGGVRYPEKFALLVLLPLTVASSFGVDELTHGSRTKRWFGAALALAALSLGAGSAFLAGAGPAAYLAPRLLQAGLAAAAGALFCLVPRSPPLLLPVGLAAVVGVDLLLAGRPLVPSMPVPDVGPPPVLRPLVARPLDGYLFHQASYDRRFGERASLAPPPAPSEWGIATALDRDWDLTAPRWSHDATAAVSEAIRRTPLLAGPILARRSVVAVLSLRPETRESGLPASATLEQAVRLWHPVLSRPFAFCADAVVAASGTEGWIETVTRLGATSAATAVLDRSDLASPRAVSGGAVRLERSGPGHLFLDVAAEGPEPSFVAVNQTWDPGWKATVDGSAVRLYRADLSLQGLFVPPGAHRVELVYANPWVWVGLAISAVSLLVCGALAARQERDGEASGAARESRASA